LKKKVRVVLKRGRKNMPEKKRTARRKEQTSKPGGGKKRILRSLVETRGKDKVPPKTKKHNPPQKRQIKPIERR